MGNVVFKGGFKHLAEVAKMRRLMRERMEELQPVLEEWERLNELNEIVEYALNEIARLNRPIADAAHVEAWLKRQGADEIIRARDLMEEFKRGNAWARAYLDRFTREGLIEKWGRGQWRLAPVRTGEARLRVMTG